MKIKKVIKIVLLIILILFILLMIHTIRNYIIIKGLQENIKEYTSSTNFHIKSVSEENSNTVVTMNYYTKDGKQVVLLERNVDGEVTNIAMYDNGKSINVFYESSKEKTVQLNSLSIIEVNLYNHLETENNWQTIIGSMMSRVRKTEHNGKECYVVNNFMSPLTLNGTEKNEVYIEKNTGIFIKSIIDSSITEREYEFENVSDEIFIEPDISEYEITPNN